MAIQKSTDRTVTGQTPDRHIASKTPKTIKSLPKDHADYWAGKLKKRSYNDRQGNLVVVPEWQVRLFQAGKEDWFNLGSANKAAASTSARDIAVHLRRHGWDSTLEKYKPKAAEKVNATVGEYLDAVKATAELRAVTFEIYARKFRTLVAGVFGVKAGREKFDYVNGGRTKWLARVNSIRLARITPERVEKWKLAYLKASERTNPLAYKRARTTINSVIRGAKSLFAAAVVGRVKVKLPDPLPFAGVSNVPVERSRYRSKIDPQALLVAAKNELAVAQPEQFKVLLLALGAGLRRDEIDTLSWNQIDWQRNVICVETNVHTAAKSAASEGEVDVDAALLAILKDYRQPGCGEFVILSPVEPRQQAGASYHYRANRIFDGLIRWLRAKGVESTNPLHTLRKEFGSLIAAQGGIFAASLALRHADIQLTRDYYLDKKSRTVLDIGKMLIPATTADSAKQNGTA